MHAWLRHCWVAQTRRTFLHRTHPCSRFAIAISESGMGGEDGSPG